MAWNRPSGAPKPVQKKPSALRGVVAGLVVVAAIGAVCVFLLSGEKDKADAKKAAKTTKIAEARPLKSCQRQVEKADGKVANEPKTAAVRSSVAESGAAEAVATDAAATAEKPKRKKIFQSGVDQVIAMALCHPKGASMPPLPDIGHDAGDEEFIQSLNKPLVIEKDDPAPIRKIKETVNEARVEIAALLKENPNASVKTLLEEHREDYNHKLDLRAEALTELEKVKSEGTDEDVRKYVTMMNLALQQVGVEEISDEEAFGSGDEEDEPGEQAE